MTFANGEYEPQVNEMINTESGHFFNFDMNILERISFVVIFLLMTSVSCLYSTEINQESTAESDILDFPFLNFKTNLLN